MTIKPLTSNPPRTDGRDPPALPGLPLLGNLLEANRDLLGMLANAARLGDVVRVSLGQPLLFLNHPDLVKHVLEDNAHSYEKGELYARLKPLLGQGLLTSEGDFWRRQRRLAQPAFHRQHIAAFAERMAHHTAAMLERWDGYAERGESLDVHPELTSLALTVISEALFSEDLGADFAAFRRALDTAQKVTDQRFRLPLLAASLPTPGTLQFNRAKRTLDALLSRVIEGRRGEERGDLLGMLMAARDEDGNGLSDAQLRDEAMTLLFGGYQTTAPALSWWVFLMATNPEAAARQAAESRAALAGRAVTLADLPKLGYTQRTLEETLRLYPPGFAIGRRALADDELGGYPIPAGTTVIMSSAILGRDPRYWENASAFDPDRFLPERSVGRPPMACFPFGAGPRQCLGNSFARMEMQVVGAMIGQRFALELSPDARIEPDPQVTLGPKHGVRVKLRRQSQG
jgi:cytochrome P450